MIVRAIAVLIVCMGGAFIGALLDNAGVEAHWVFWILGALTGAFGILSAFSIDSPGFEDW